MELWSPAAGRTGAGGASAVSTLSGDPARLSRFLDDVRTLAGLDVICATWGVDPAACRTLVGSIGARITQMRCSKGNKRTVCGVIGAGWGPAGKGSPDIRRAYSALTSASARDVERAAARWVRYQRVGSRAGYYHYAHLYAVATGALPALDGLTRDRHVQGAYLQAWSRIQGAVDGALDAIATLGGPHPLDVEQARTALADGFWLLDNAPAFTAALRGGGKYAGSAQLRSLRRELGAALGGDPDAFAPGSLGELGRTQWRALLFSLRVGAPEADTAVKTGREDLGVVLAGAWERLAASNPEMYSRSELHALSGDWVGHEPAPAPAPPAPEPPPDPWAPRVAGPGDVEAIAAMAEAALGGADRSGDVADAVGSGHAVVAYAAGGLVAFRYERALGPHTLGDGLLLVCPALAGLGLGERVLAAFEDTAPAWALMSVVAHTSTGEPRDGEQPGTGGPGPGPRFWVARGYTLVGSGGDTHLFTKHLSGGSR